ncbi:enoyl-CoA hydratase-related protein [Streptomyces avicenniae]|uniref:enoyl-CoA hydratase-related protein n=1 Tax=Streptomyces avicenniae TaxID=500153 RepID=UPI00069A6944|nr:enoyl-CoA hydratase-related protein [Streptomyces avicenniae]
MPEPHAQGTVRAHRDPDGILTLTPDLTHDPAAALTATADLLAAEAEGVRGVVLALAGRAFLAGDPDDLRHAGHADAPRLFDAARRAGDALRRVETSGIPVVAALGGDALGGVLATALACHHRIALDTPGSRIGLPDIRLGLLPGGGSITRTVRLLGVAAALRHVVLDGTEHTPARALDLGLVHELATDQADMTRRARAWLDSDPDPRQPWDAPGHRIPGGTPADPAFAATLPTLPALLRERTGGAPAPAPRAALAAAVEGTQVDLATATTIEARYLTEVATGPVARAMLQALHSDLATVRAAHPRTAPVRRPRRVAVLGAGGTGARLARLCAAAGADVTDDPTGCDTVVEATEGDTAQAAAALRAAEEVAAPGALLCATTPGTPLAALAAALRAPHSLVGLRAFSPVDGTPPLAEITRGTATDDEATGRALDVAHALGATPLVVRGDSLVLRLTGRYLAEGLALVAEGVPAPSIEQAAAQAGFTTPVLALLDATGHAALRLIASGLAGAGADAVLAKMAGEFARPGRAAGAGFHDYEDGRRVRLWPGLREHFAQATPPPPFDDLRERLLLAPAIEALRSLDDGTAASAAEATIGSLLGLGFPAWTGGAVAYAHGNAARARDLAGRYGARFTPPR